MPAEGNGLKAIRPKQNASPSWIQRLSGGHYRTNPVLLRRRQCLWLPTQMRAVLAESPRHDGPMNSATLPHI
jgi:hypothetical protein